MKFSSILFAAFGALLLPAFAFAAGPTVAGIEHDSLIKSADSSAVYYFTLDETRYTFPNEYVFYSWYDDFSNVIEISSVDLAAIPLAGVMPYQPGTLLQFEGESTVYASLTDVDIVPIANEAAAEDYFGSNWAAGIVVLPMEFKATFVMNADVDALEEEPMYEDVIPVVVEHIQALTWSEMNLMVEPDVVYVYSEPLRFATEDEGDDCDWQYCYFNSLDTFAGRTVKFVNYTDEPVTIRAYDNAWTTGTLEAEDIAIIRIPMTDYEVYDTSFHIEEDDSVWGELHVEEDWDLIERFFTLIFELIEVVFESLGMEDFSAELDLFEGMSEEEIAEFSSQVEEYLQLMRQ